jgi:hypothetical protein
MEKHDCESAVDFKNLGKREMRLLAALRTGSAVIFTEGHGKKKKGY